MSWLSPIVVRVAAAMSVAGLLLAAGCSSGTDRDAAEIAERLQERVDGALSEEQALCVATELLDAFETDDFEQVIAAAQNRTEGDRSGDIRTQVIDIWSDCDAIGALIDLSEEQDDP